MKTYETLSEALTDLQIRGFVYDFNLSPDTLDSDDEDIHLKPEEFTVVEVHRFEGSSSTDDEAVIYAIESKNGLKGILIDAYGAYAENVNPEMLKKLHTEYKLQHH